MPIAVLTVEPGPEAGLQQLLGLRDWWTARGELVAALAATRELLGRRKKALGADHPDTWLEVAAHGALLSRLGQAAGVTELDEAWTALRSRAGGRDLRVAVVAQNVAAARLREGKLDEAEHALESAYRIRKDKAPATIGLVAAQLGELRVRLGRAAAGLPLLVEALQATTKAEGEASPRAMARAHMLGTVYNQLERWADAAKVLRPVHARLAPDADPDVRAALAFELGLALHRTGGSEEGVRRIEEAVRVTRELGQGGKPHPSLANRLVLLAQLQLEKRRLDEAEGLLLEALEVDRRAWGDSSVAVAVRQVSLGQFLVQFGRVAEGLGFLDAGVSLLRTGAGDADARTRSATQALVELLTEEAKRALDARDKGLATAFAGRGLELAEAVLGRTDGRTRKLRDFAARHRLGVDVR